MEKSQSVMSHDAVETSSSEPVSTGVTPRREVASLPEYVAGKLPDPQQGLRAYKVSSNENALGPVREAVQAAASVDQFHRYPEPSSISLRQVIGETLGISADHIMTGTGSLGCLSQILAAFVGPGEDGFPGEVVYPWRSFEAYPILVTAAGAQGVQVPLTPTGGHDLPAMLSAVTKRTKIVFLCTPNNPTGVSLSHEEIDEFMQQISPKILVIVDEAYVEYVRDEDPLDSLALLEKYPNLVSLRTFSKAHGLADLRVGYSISSPELNRHIAKVAPPFSVSTVGSAAAIASLGQLAQVNQNVDSIVAERERVSMGLREHGWNIPESQGNFIWLPLGDLSDEFTQTAASMALAVRGFSGEGVRVSIGETEANDRLLEICAAFPKS